MKSFIALTFLLMFGSIPQLHAETPTSQPDPEISYETIDVAGGPWKIIFKPFTVDRGTYVLKQTVLEIVSPQVKVDFITDTTWCVHRIVHADHIINSPTGGTGSVVHWDGKPVGTVHGGEIVESVVLNVDGKSISLMTNGKPQFDRSTKWGGETITLTKRSVIGPFHHEAEFVFAGNLSSYVATHRYKADVAITPERFKGYRYVFMQMMPPEFSQWQRIEADGKSVNGSVTTPAGPSTGKDKDRVVWTERVRSVACYAPDWQTGIVYAYPESYEGLSHFVDRGRKDRKFRGILFTKDQYDAGEELQWRMRCTVFDAPQSEWQTTAETLANLPF